MNDDISIDTGLRRYDGLGGDTVPRRYDGLEKGHNSHKAHETRIQPNIWQRGSKIVIRARINNRSVTRTIGKINDPDIIQKAKSELSALRGRAPHDSYLTPNLTVNQVVLEYWKHRKQVRRLSPNTINNERCRLLKIINYWGPHQLNRITTIKIESSIPLLFDDNAKVQPSTINKYLSTLSTFFKFCLTRGYANTNPMDGVARYKVNNNRLRYLSRTEYSNLLLACSKARRESVKHKGLYSQLMHMIILSVHLGLRKGELLNIKVEDIDLEARYLTLRHTKNGKIRNLPLTPAAIRAIGKELYPRTPESRGYLFMKNGKPLDDFYHRWARVRLLADLPGLHWHDLRHTYCSWATMAGVDSSTIQEVLGHCTSSLTKRYTHLSAEHKINSADTFSAWLSRTA